MEDEVQRKKLQKIEADIFMWHPKMQNVLIFIRYRECNFMIFFYKIFVNKFKHINFILTKYLRN